MENNASETLEKGFVESNHLSLSGAQDPGNKIIERPESVSFCNIRENWIAHDNVGYKESPIKLEREVGDGRIQESMVSDVITIYNRQTNKGSLYVDHDNKLLVLNNTNKFVNNCASVFEGDDGSNTLHPHEPDSPTKIEVSGNGINLSVDMFGPLDGICDINNDVYENENNKTLSTDVKNRHEDGEIVGKQKEYTFGVGDLVWVKTRTKVWWPGMILDPSNAEKHATVSEKKGTFLVKHFGNQHFVWCSNSVMRPFIEYFEEFSTKNDSNNFSGSIQKALCEISRRVKSKMSCSCFAKEDQRLSSEIKKENSTSTEKVCKFEVRSLPQFDPASFVANVKRLASTGSVPGKIDLIIMENRLSAFYHSVGRCQLPSQLLRPSCSDPADNSKIDAVIESKRLKRNHTVKSGLVYDDKVNSSSKGSESRPRKKSKYLSYPYVDANKGVESNLGEDTQTTAPIGTNLGKKGSKKNFVVRKTVSKKDNINASSGELLTELHATAVDYSHHCTSKYLDSLKRFYCSFRIFAFLDTKISSKLVGAQIKGVETVKECENQGVSVETVKQGLNITERDNAEVKSHKRKGKKKKEEAMAKCVESKSDSLAAMNSNIITPNIINPCSMISFQQTCSSDVSKHKITPEVDMITKPDFSSGEPYPSVTQGGKPLPENLNGSVVISPKINGSVDQTKAFSSVPLLKVTLQNIPQSTEVGLYGTSSQVKSGGFIFPNAINIGIASSGKKPEEPKKRKRKEKTSQVAASVVILPDLNGNVLPEGNHPVSPPEGEPHLKRMMCDESGSSVKRRRVVNNKEDPGGGLLLKFAPDFPPPSKETLMATFSRFGLLKESEIQVVDDSSTQIMYERSSDAGFAFRSLEKSNPFGSSLTSFNLHRMPATDPKTTRIKKRKVKKVHQLLKNQQVNKEAPPYVGEEGDDDVGVIKKKVEMMKLALDKAGDTVSPEMRAKLENEIKTFLDKIGSSSS